MREYGSIFIIIAMTLILVACGGKESEDDVAEDKERTDVATDKIEKRVFEAEQRGISNKITFHYQGDQVIKQEAYNVFPYKTIGADSKEDAEKTLSPESEKFQDIDGVTHEMEYNDTEAIETLEIDFEIVDFEEAKDLPGMMFAGDAKENGISMEKTAETLLNQGFEEIE